METYINLEALVIILVIGFIMIMIIFFLTYRDRNK